MALRRNTSRSGAGVLVSGALGLMIAGGWAPEIAEQPEDLTISPDKSGMFICKARGDIPSDYRWQIKRPGHSSFVDLPDGVESTLGSHGMGEADNGAQLRCIASNELGSATSQTVTLTYRK